MLLNDQLHWRGQLKGGSYCEGEVYATNIQISTRPFEFPPPLPPLAPPFAPPLPQNDDWLEKEAVEQQMRQLEEEERREKVKKIGSMRSTVGVKYEGEGGEDWLVSPGKRERRERQAIEESRQERVKEPVKP